MPTQCACAADPEASQQASSKLVVLGLRVHIRSMLVVAQLLGLEASARRGPKGSTRATTEWSSFGYRQVCCGLETLLPCFTSCASRRLPEAFCVGAQAESAPLKLTSASASPSCIFSIICSTWWLSSFPDVTSTSVKGSKSGWHETLALKYIGTSRTQVLMTEPSALAGPCVVAPVSVPPD
jgi:hypothetical protein